MGCRSGTGVVGTLRGHDDWVWTVAFSPMVLDCSGSQDQNFAHMGCSVPTEIGPPFVGHDEEVMSVAFSPDGARIVSDQPTNSVRVWDVVSCTEVVTLNQIKGNSTCVIPLYFLRWHSYSFWAGEAICIWDAVSGTEVCPRLRGHDSGLLQLHYLQMPLASSPGQLIALCVYGMLCPALKWCHFSDASR